MNIKNRKSPKILVFQLNWLGDILFSYPFLRALKRSFPDSSITCAVVPSYSELLKNNPWVESVLELSRRKGAAALLDNLSFVFKARKEKYDICFFLKPSRTKALMAMASGIQERIGPSGKNALLTTSVDVPQGEIHRADIILSLAGALGITEADGTYEYFFSLQDVERAEEILRSSGSIKEKRVALNPGGNWAPKRWPKERFIDLGKKLLNKYPDIEIVVTGAGKDKGLAREIVSKINSKRCYSVAGKTGITELAAIFKKCSLVVSADSGPLHLASAAGANTIGIFGPTSPVITGARGSSLNIVMHKPTACRIPCYVEECDKAYECMLSVTAEDVFVSAVSVLSSKG